MQVNLMGTLEVLADGRDVTPATPKPRQVLAQLAVHAGKVVSADQLMDELWPDGPPASAQTTLQTYVYQLRKTFGGGGARNNGKGPLVTRQAGYVLDVRPEDVDVFRFEQLASAGRAALRRGEPRPAADLLRQALASWRGPALTDVRRGPRLEGYATYLEEQHMQALSLRIEADIAIGRHREVVGELRALVMRHRLHEDLYLRLMQALHHSGRRGDALQVYHQLRRVLKEELGLGPSIEVRRLQHEILADAVAGARQPSAV